MLLSLDWSSQEEGSEEGLEEGLGSIPQEQRGQMYRLAGTIHYSLTTKAFNLVVTIAISVNSSI